VHGQLDASEQPFRHRIRDSIATRKDANNRGYLESEERVETGSDWIRAAVTSGLPMSASPDSDRIQRWQEVGPHQVLGCQGLTSGTVSRYGPDTSRQHTGRPFDAPKLPLSRGTAGTVDRVTTFASQRLMPMRLTGSEDLGSWRRLAICATEGSRGRSNLDTSRPSWLARACALPKAMGGGCARRG